MAAFDDITIRRPAIAASGLAPLEALDDLHVPAGSLGRMTQAPVQKVTVLGSIQDLSGPLASLGKQVRTACSVAWTSSTSSPAASTIATSCY